MNETPRGAGPAHLPEDIQRRVNRWAILASVVRGTVHSLNNVLQTIGGQAELLAQHDGASDDVLRRAARIAVQNERAASQLRELSGVAREIPDAPDRTDVRQALDRAVALRQYDLLRAQVAIEIQQEPETIPPAAIDGPALVQILLNLLLNAEQALAGTPGARIHVRLESRGDRIVVRIQDNGPGVPADARDRIFEPFFTTARPGATLGLGLAVSRRIAGAHGGRLVLAEEASAPGARFDLELPVAGA